MTRNAGSRSQTQKTPFPGSEGKPDFFDRIQNITEKYLTFRRKCKRVKKEKQQAKNVIVDWIEAFLWAAGVVLLINQYLFQAYQIPSGSMIDTLLIGDRIFVNKIVYGPELLPGVAKLPSPIKPKRNDIIIFENPEYLSRGLAFDVAQRIIFMLTLSFVDIDKDERGQPRVHFLIKRAVGMGGDWFVQNRGNMRLRPAGDSSWIEESEFNRLRGVEHNLSRLVNEADYPALEAAGKTEAYRDLRLPPPSSLTGIAAGLNNVRYPDRVAFEKARREVLRGAYPHNANYSASLARDRLGRYVPESRILPLGDNRDNSQDGRFFGPVRSDKILGRGSLIFWPGDFGTRRLAAFDRFGFIR